MSLIACLHPTNSRTLMADILISSSDLRTDDVVLPTRSYIPPNKLHTLPLKPTTLCRKVIEIDRNWIGLWSGPYSCAHSFAMHLQNWFQDRPINHDTMSECLKNFSDQSKPTFAAIVASTTGDVCYTIGECHKGESPFAGKYLVAGSGTPIFQKMMTEMPVTEDQSPAGDMNGLRIASELLNREITTTEEMLKARIGGAYEILVHRPSGFERVDDVMHFWTLVNIQDGRIEDVLYYSHALRQWYENNQLCIASFSSTDAHEQGLVFGAFAAPSILEEQTEIVRSTNDLQTYLKYLCIYHLFKRDQ
jgi:hypothetical protein